MYLTLFSIVLFFSLIEIFLKRNQKFIVYLFCCSLLIFLTVLRRVDATPWPDTGNYVKQFPDIVKGENRTGFSILEWEPGFVLLLRLLGLFSTNGQFMMTALGLFIRLPIFCCFWRYSKLPILSLLIFIAHSHFTNTSIYRQWCAIAILCFSLKSIKQRDFIRFLFWVGLAFFFHRTAVIFMLAYFAYKLPVNRRMVGGGYYFLL